MAVAVDVPRGPVEASLNFSFQPPAGKKAINYVEDPPEGEPKRNLEVNAQQVLIHDIRGAERDFTLDRDAFQFISGLPPSAEVAFTDDESIEKNYYPEVEKLLLDNIPGAHKVVIFDHTVRRAHPGSKRTAVFSAHIDQTGYAAEKRVQRHIPDEKEAEALLRGRYRIINVWRSLNPKPVEATPLAFASSSTLDQKDVIPVEHRYPHGYIGQTAAIAHSPSQRWYYASGMTGDERLLLECFDSDALRDGSPVQGGRVAHTAFVDPRTRLDAEGRESIEIRTLVFGP